MSFMSFDYAMRASEAALTFQQNQGQNIKDTNARVREVGTGNAKRKDDLMREKVKAEYDARSADIKKEKAEKLMAIAKNRKENALKAEALVGIGTFVGGFIDGMKDLKNADKNQMPKDDQVTMDSGDIQVGKNTAAFRIAAGNGNSEQGAIVSFDKSKGNFSVVGVNTTSGQVNGFVNVSATDMAKHILDTIGDHPDTPGVNEREAGGNNRALLSMIDQGPPPSFKPSAYKDGKNPSSGLTDEAQSALFGANGFFSQGSNPSGGPLSGSDAGEQMAAGLLRDAAPITGAYHASAKGVLNLLENEQVQNGLQLADGPKLAKKTRSIFEDQKVLGNNGPSALQKLFFKPLGTSLNQFMAMAKVAKEYEEEYNQKVAEYDAAKKQAANAYKKLQKLEGLLASGGASS